MMELPDADKRRVSNKSALKGDGLMAGERDSEKVACDMAVTDLCTGRRSAVADIIALRADLMQRSTALLGRLIAENGSERAWRESGFFILAML
jgi:hypothetical protein